MDNLGTTSTERPSGSAAESCHSQVVSRDQAQLALLAAQLAELADVNEDEYSCGVEGVQGKDRVATTGVPEGAVSTESTENDDDDMDMVEIPMSSLTT